MNIGRMFANAVIRRLAYVLVGLVFLVLSSLFGAADAHAQACPPTIGARQTTAGIGLTYPDVESAVQACNSTASPGTGNLTSGWHDRFNKQQCTVNVAALNVTIHWEHIGVWSSCESYYGDVNSTKNTTATGWSFQALCPEGGEWNESLGKCFDPEECLARNGASNGMPLTPVSKPFQQKCVAGCTLAMESGLGSSCTVVHLPGGSETHCSGVFQYSGEVCDATPPSDDSGPEPEQDSCTSTGPNSGVKVCKKPDGRECFESNSGAMICWGVGETGQRATGSDAQTRGPGNTEPSPDPPTPPEEFDPAKKGDPVTTTTTTNNPNGSTTTTTTTVINNSTTHGTTPPGTPGSNPGPGGGAGGGEDGDEDGNSASGGGSCEEPPVVDGDAALGMIAKQAWETRCALEKIREGSTVTGDVGDCDSPFTVEGNDANAQRLRAMREQICPGGSEAGAGDGNNIDWSGLDGPDSAEGTAFFGEDVVIGEDGLDTSGLGFSRSCPTIPPVNVFGQVIQFDNSVMCDWLELGGTILLILSALLSVRIMSGVGT